MANPRGTEEHLRAADRRSVGTVIAVALATVLVANVGAGLWLDSQTGNLGYWLIQQKWRRLADLDAPVDTLILGDSAGNQGLDNRAFDAATGRRSVNLCTIGNTIAVDDLWMLEEYIERFGAPQRVVLIHVYDVWHRTFEEMLLARIPRVGLAWAQDEVPLGGSGLVRFVLAKYLRLFAENRSLRALVLRPWERPRAGFALDPQGFMAVASANPHGVRRDVASHLRFVGAQSFVMSAQNRAALDRIGAHADTHGFDLFVVNSPINDHLAADAGFGRYFAAVQRALEEIAALHPRMHNLPRTYVFGEHEMENADHLVAAAASVYARAVAAEIEVAARRIPSAGSGEPGGAKQ